MSVRSLFSLRGGTGVGSAPFDAALDLLTACLVMGKALALPPKPADDVKPAVLLQNGKDIDAVFTAEGA